ncbi:sugar ABC transporter ATP-binding protein [candidate division KSB3 bacterium]|uniref:Sugar ABC transporter ATP-binding protein n=1 Tax=candidate division KSB3 bacterium TaxID=2044937 RepID=A0A2G6E6S5_9BACT|nr:MAG: sugar ABC transporter ATP-binding protein [candidate division KSB3 bacterium]PIE30211.1 MAG: sugar ABC transporter ATP-binding protein [candidate division KSB3 bacterium]
MTETQRDFHLYIPVYSIFLLIYCTACFIEPSFFTWNNNVNLFTRITPLILAGMAQTCVVLTGGIDLSVGAIIGLTNVVAASLPFVDTPWNIILWVCIPPLVGLVVGLINGLIITRGDFPPLIVTLATGAIWKGVTLFLMPIPGGEVSLAVAVTLTGKLWKSIPIPLAIFVIAVFLCHLTLTKTSFGRSIYAIGGNKAIAYESGIPCTQITIGVYAVSGVLCACAGMFLSAWMFSADPLVGEAYILNSIAVTVIAGTPLSGGKGGVLGIIGAAYIFLLISNILNLLAISTFYQFVAKGIVLIIALAITSSGTVINTGKFLANVFSTKSAQPGGRRYQHGKRA